MRMPSLREWRMKMPRSEMGRTERQGARSVTIGDLMDGDLSDAIKAECVAMQKWESELGGQMAEARIEIEYEEMLPGTNTPQAMHRLARRKERLGNLDGKRWMLRTIRGHLERKLREAALGVSQ